jgi:hypothetical protein
MRNGAPNQGPRFGRSGDGFLGFAPAVRRRDQPHVGPHRLVAPDPLERLLFQQAEDLGLYWPTT